MLTLNAVAPSSPRLLRPYPARVLWAQVAALTVANLKSRYRKTWAGFVWVVLNPLILYGVQSQVFSRVLKLDIHQYAVFLAAGLLPWIFMVQSLDMTTTIFQHSGKLLKSYPIDPRVYLFAQLADNLINFIGAFLLVLVPLTVWHQVPWIRLAAVPVCLIPLILGITGLSWFLASLQLFFADVRFLVSFAMGVLFFLTPIFYPIELVPETWRWAVGLNPLFRWISPFQLALQGGTFRDFLSSWTMSLGLGAAMLLLAALYWRRYRNAIFFRL